MLVEDCTLFVFFFLKQLPSPVAVTGPSDCTLLVAVVWAGLEPEGDYFSCATPGGERGKFQIPVSLPGCLSHKPPWAL